MRYKDLPIGARFGWGDGSWHGGLEKKKVSETHYAAPEIFTGIEKIFPVDLREEDDEVFERGPDDPVMGPIPVGGPAILITNNTGGR